MSERDDWLWDRSGKPDPVVERCERLLARFAHDPDAPLAPRRPARSRWILSGAVAAALVLVALGAWLGFAEPDGYATRGYAVARVHAGDRVVARDDPVAIEIGALGELELERGTRLVIGNDSVTEHAFYLERGRVRASIVAAPRVLSIGTPAGLTVDLGCRYTIEVADDGASVLSVTEGRVAFERDERRVVVPAGARTSAHRDAPARVPVFRDAPADWIALVRAIEDDPAPGRQAIERVVREARPLDSLTLLHLAFLAPSEELRAEAHQVLREQVPEPPGGEGLSTGDPRAWEAWLERLKLDWPY